MEIEEYVKGLICCQWCGTVRSEKVSILRDGREKVVVCRRHFQNPLTPSGLMNVPTQEAVVRLWEQKVS